MAITYTNPAGTHITSYAMTETLATQAQQTGNNTVIVTDLLSVIGGGQIGDGTNGRGDTYSGRLLIIDLGLSTEQRRRCVGDAAGTGTTRILTVNEDWDTNPVITTDTIHVCYETADIEDGGAGGGVGFQTRTGFFTFTNVLTIDAGGGMQNSSGTAIELDDAGSGITLVVNGDLYSGYQHSGASVGGGLFIAVNNVAGEPLVQFGSGSGGYVYDAVFWGQLTPLQFEHAAGAGTKFFDSRLINATRELILYDAEIHKGSVSGKGNAAEILRVNAGSIIKGFTLNVLGSVDSAADTTTETLELSDVIYAGVTNPVSVRQNKTWNMIDPVWFVADYTDLNWIGTATGNELNDKRSITATVQESDGTLLENALVNVYENTILADLVLELSTDAAGLAEGSFIYKKHATNSVTTTYGGHSLQAGKWLYLPFVAAQVSTTKFDGTIVLAPDNNIVQTTQATAKSAGSTVTWNEDTNPSALFGFDTGSGTLLVGMILTFSGGATGTITESKDGDSVSGVLHLKDRNATAIGATDTFSRTGGTAGTFSGTCNATVSPIQAFSIWIDAQTLSYQTIYDYLAAIQNETTLTADGELIWEWCRNAQSQPLYSTGSSFFTERSNSKGIIVVDGGSGTVDYFTDDAGVTWTAPATVTVQVTVLDDDTGLAIELAHVLLYLDDYSTQVLNAATNASGIASASFAYTTDEVVEGWARNVDHVGTDYEPGALSGTITASGLSLTVRLTPSS